ncbi:hypothetical protein KFE94_02085 [bacterium SCSIO 12643]|nr:hypothetical protein KFE94_02085 [bacterium SCSIO 12643]
MILAAIWANSYWQVFCNPSSWAIVFITISFLYTIILPFVIKYKKYHFIIGFIGALSFWMYLYCIIFLGEMNFWGLIFIFTGSAILTFTPHFLAGQIWYKLFLKEGSKMIRKAFFVGSKICLVGVLSVGILYASALEDVEAFEQSNYRELEPNFFNEKILGMHLIYHTRFCGYDGWRPPIHEPLLVLGMWMNRGAWGINIALEKRIELYQKFFPNKPVHLECSCAEMYSETYHNDELFK